MDVALPISILAAWVACRSTSTAKHRADAVKSNVKMTLILHISDVILMPLYGTGDFEKNCENCEMDKESLIMAMESAVRKE